MRGNKKYNFKEIEYCDIKLNLSTPRLPKSKQDKDEATIIEFMLLESVTLELMMAIGQNDFFPGEQLLVIKDDAETEKYIVVEGNRRLTAVKLLSNPELANVKKESIKQIIQEAIYKPQKIPCLVFENKKDILKHLGFKHITGGKTWRTLEKARYLYILKQDDYPNIPFKKACRKLAKSVGCRMNYIEKMVISYDIFRRIEETDFYKILNLNDTTLNFGYIVGSLNQTRISDFLGIDFDSENPLKHLNLIHLKKLTFWLFERNSENRTRLIGDSFHLDKLDKILGNSKAFKAFDKDGITLDKAVKMVDESYIKMQNNIIESR